MWDSDQKAPERTRFWWLFFQLQSSNDITRC